MRWWCLLLCMCGSSEQVSELLVDVRTDLHPGLEIDAVRVRLAEQERVAEVGEGDWVRGNRVASFEAQGFARLEVAALLRGQVVVERDAVTELRGERVGVTVTLTRSCIGVVCDPETTCLGGRCVDSACLRGDEAACGSPMCEAPSACGAATECGSWSCEEGTCLLIGADDRCGTSQYCAPLAGCACPDAQPLSAAASPLSYESDQLPVARAAALPEDRMAIAWVHRTVDDAGAASLGVRTVVTDALGVLVAGPWDVDLESAPMPEGVRQPVLRFGAAGGELFYIAGWGAAAQLTWRSDDAGAVVEAPRLIEAPVLGGGPATLVRAEGRWWAGLFDRESEGWSSRLLSSGVEGERVVAPRFPADRFELARFVTVAAGRDGLYAFGVSPDRFPQNSKRCVGGRIDAGSSSVTLEVLAPAPLGRACFIPVSSYHPGAGRFLLAWPPGEEAVEAEHLGGLQALVMDDSLGVIAQRGYATPAGGRGPVWQVEAMEDGWRVIFGQSPGPGAPEEDALLGVLEVDVDGEVLVDRVTDAPSRGGALVHVSGGYRAVDVTDGLRVRGVCE